ncbi:MAG: hypothetical protein P8L85_10265 [Rubripirellula sp.]|nr:hypothetical protein [Rubripirellula sp.]
MRRDSDDLLTEVFILLSTSEQRVLLTFHQYLMTPGKMLCFSGPSLERYVTDLDRMVDKKLLIREKFKGGYSLSRTGFAAMKDCVQSEDEDTSNRVT